MTNEPKYHPPRWATRFLYWYCPDVLLEEIEGDLYENFYQNLDKKGLRAARLWYITDVIRFCNPVTFRRAKRQICQHDYSLNLYVMIRSFFIAAIRNLKKNKLYAAINVAGLALGVACCITIFLLVRFETSFDNFHSKADRIYRVNIYQEQAMGRKFNAYNFYPLGEAIRAEVTGLEAVTSMHHGRNYQFTVGENIYDGEQAFFVDTAYFDVFDGKWLVGNPENALSEPNTVVVTDKFAEKYLGGIEKSLDTTFVFENKLTLKVTGVLESPPYNTDMPYVMLISYPTLPQYIPESVDNWKWVGWGATFIALNEGGDPGQIAAQLEKIKQKYLPEEDAKHTSFTLMPLEDNHDSNGGYNSFTYDFPLPLMVILSIVAGMIAFIACINFINLATAQSLNRAREVGIRKTLGSSRFQLILQYMSEALVITCTAVVCGLALAKIPMRILNAEAGRDYLNFHFFQEPSLLLFVAGIILLLTLLAGFYPAFVLSGFQPVKALNGKINVGRPKGINLRKSLVVTQFVGAQVLILVTVIIINQINLFKERPLGFDASAIVYSFLPDTSKDLSYFRQQLAQNPNIQNYTFGLGTSSLSFQRMQFYGDEGEDFKMECVFHAGDENYLSMNEHELIAGKNFTADQQNPASEVIVNEALVKALGIEQPEEAVGRIFTLENKEVVIRGVMKDFYNEALSNKISPLVLQYPSRFVAVAIKIAPDHMAETLEYFRNAWEATFPENLYDYQFLDEALDRQYGFFDYILGFLEPAAFLAIFIGCMGLYGLISFMAVQRTKEIGIRKVLGATVANIMMMFTKESLWLIAVAFVIAAPIGYFLGQAMLMEFPERVNPGLHLFVITLSASLLIAWLTIGYQSFKAALANPTDSLRHE